MKFENVAVMCHTSLNISQHEPIPRSRAGKLLHVPRWGWHFLSQAGLLGLTNSLESLTDCCHDLPSRHH